MRILPLLVPLILSITSTQSTAAEPAGAPKKNPRPAHGLRFWLE